MFIISNQAVKGNMKWFSQYSLFGFSLNCYGGEIHLNLIIDLKKAEFGYVPEEMRILKIWLDHWLGNTKFIEVIAFGAD